VEAHQVGLEKTFFKILEKDLNQNRPELISDKKVEVIALGGSGNGSLRALELYQQYGRRYSPDHVLVFLTEQNDFDDDYWFYLKKTGREARPEETVEPTVNLTEKMKFYETLIVFPKSILNQWLAFQITKIKYAEQHRRHTRWLWEIRMGLYAIPGTELYKKNPNRWEEAFSITASGYRLLREETAKTGAGMSVVFVDNRFTYYPPARKNMHSLIPSAKTQASFHRPTQRMKRFLDSLKISYWDLNPDFMKHFRSTRRQAHFPNDGHWNEEGHALTAQSVSRYLRDFVF
jgi:hypothetical protein